MPGRFLALLFFASTSTLPPRIQAEGKAPPPLLAATDDAGLKAAKGSTVLVRGKVTRTGKAKATGANFLNFGAGDFTVVVFGKNLKEFAAGEPADVFQNQCIEVRGEVTLYKDKPQIEITSPTQIKRVDEKAVAAAATKPADAGDGAPAKAAPPADGDAKMPTTVDPRKYFTD